jgi:hypothetical protein
LLDHQQADEAVKNLAKTLWADEVRGREEVQHAFGKGKVIWSTSAGSREESNL